MSVKTRLANLEKRATGAPGGLAIVYLTGDDHEPLPIEEQERLLAEAHAEVGENGTVLIITREDARRS